MVSVATEAIMENRESSLAKTLRDLDNAIGVSGNEEAAAEVLSREMDGLCDERFDDPLGNLYFVRYGRERDRRVMFAAHLDEIGFVVRRIEEEGFARVFPVGYHDDRTGVNQDLVFVTASGAMVYGVTGSKPTHILPAEERCRVIKTEDLFVDFGTESAAETRALGLEIGDYGTFARTGRFLNGTDFYSGKSVDDRAGLAVIAEALRRLRGADIAPTVCMAGSVQEEMGMRAGGPLVSRWRPEVFFSVDGVVTGGTPDIEYRQCPMRMGGGVAVKFFDWDKGLACGNNVPRKLTRRMVEAAERHGIPYQREVSMGGGTDAWPAALAGVLSGGIGFPTRYIHTAVGMVKLSDLDACADFIVAFLQDY